MEHIVEVCRKTGKAAGTIAFTPETLVTRIQEGYRLICAGMDVNHLQAIFRQMRETAQNTIRDLGIPSDR